VPVVDEVGTQQPALSTGQPFVEACAAPVDDQRAAQLNARRRGCYFHQDHAKILPMIGG